LSEKPKKEKLDWLERRNSDWVAGRNSTAEGAPLLIADDSDTDVFFLLRAFSDAKVRNPIYVVRSGTAALDYLQGKGEFTDRSRFPAPRIVLLDLRMPTPDGFELLQWKLKQPDMKSVLFVAMSNFGTADSVNKAYAAGATTFLSKPLNVTDIRNLVESFDEHWVRNT
jgi:CheY-like chemotaxis protein